MFDIQRFAVFENPATSDLKISIPINAEGNIAQVGETAAANKVFTVKGFKTDGDADEADAVFTEIFSNIANTTYDTLSATQTIVRKMVDD